MIYIQQLEGLGGLNEAYLGLAYQLGKLSLGVNISYLFGKVEDRLTLVMQPATSGYYLKSQTLTHISSSLFTLGFQLPLQLTKKSELTLGGSFNFGTPLHGNRTFIANKISNTSGTILNVNNESWDNGEIFYPFRFIVGATYQYNKKWLLSGDYTFQKCPLIKNLEIIKNFRIITKRLSGDHYNLMNPDVTGGKEINTRQELILPALSIGLITQTSIPMVSPSVRKYLSVYLVKN